MAAPPPLQHSLSLLNDDVLTMMLTKADVPTMHNLKGVSRSWRSRGRRALWARLCHREGQPVPTSRDNVIDVDIEPDASATGATTRSSVAADDDDWGTASFGMSSAAAPAPAGAAGEDDNWQTVCL